MFYAKATEKPHIGEQGAFIFHINLSVIVYLDMPSERQERYLSSSYLLTDLSLTLIKSGVVAYYTVLCHSH